MPASLQNAIWRRAEIGLGTARHGVKHGTCACIGFCRHLCWRCYSVVGPSGRWCDPCKARRRSQCRLRCQHCCVEPQLYVAWPALGAGLCDVRALQLMFFCALVVVVRGPQAKCWVLEVLMAPSPCWLCRMGHALRPSLMARWVLPGPFRCLRCVCVDDLLLFRR